VLTGLPHRLVAHPWVYVRIQTLAGHNRVLERLSQEDRATDVVDVGGGTGAVRNLLAADYRCICLDLEMPTLMGFRSRVPRGLAVLGDATSMPVIDG